MEQMPVIKTETGQEYCLKDLVLELVAWYDREIEEYKAEYHYNGTPHRDNELEHLKHQLEIEG